MQKYLLPSSLLGLTWLLASCGSSLKPLSADCFTVSPQPLEEVGGKVPFTISGRFPEKYMNRKAALTLTPYVVYAGGKEQQSAPASFQGERVAGNSQEVSYRLGGNFTLRGSVDFADGMQQSDLVLRFAATLGDKPVQLPEVKVGNGVLATAALVGRTAASAKLAMSEDKYQYATQQQQRAQIKYLVAQSNIRTSELEGVSVQDFVKTLKNIKEDEKGFQIEGIDIAAYASPEGSASFNERLAQLRGKSSSDYVGSELQQLGLSTDVNTGYTAEDWEGFRELVEQSNIQDKDIILRVLSMYTDPEERERQIRNLSAAYQELADVVLPELRRARITVNYLSLGRTDDDIQAQYKADPTKLSTDELLYLGTLVEDEAEREGIYVSAAAQAPADYRAYNNLGVLAFNKGDMALAERYFDEAAEKNPSAAEVNANRAQLLLTKIYGTDGARIRDEVQTLLGNASTAKNYVEVLGCYQIANGQYGAAARNMSDVHTNSAALAQLLNRDYLAAAQTLTSLSAPDGMTYYLRALVAARSKQNDLVAPNLREAYRLDPSLRQLAKQDLELAGLPLE